MTGHTISLDEAFVSAIVRRTVESHFAASESAGSPQQLFQSERAQDLKEEIVAVGRKLWQRGYVDGNGGNISARLTRDWVICTPTMLSKADLQPQDLTLTDLEGNQLVGDRSQTSEILLHLEIYKALPHARAVVHCHPPYATAYAVAGVIPEGDLVPEQEVFIGPVAMAPYDSPGTIEFARTVLPMVKQHNTILLANHGIVSWADTVTHAEWYAEIIDNYCKILTIASQLKSPLPKIPQDKIQDLLAMKMRHGLPDSRLPDTATPELPEDSYSPAGGNNNNGAPVRVRSKEEIEKLVQAVTAEILKYVDSCEGPTF